MSILRFLFWSGKVIVLMCLGKKVPVNSRSHPQEKKRK